MSLTEYRTFHFVFSPAGECTLSKLEKPLPNFPEKAPCLVSASTPLLRVYTVVRVYSGLQGGRDLGSLGAIRRGRVGGRRWGVIWAAHWAVEPVDVPGPLVSKLFKNSLAYSPCSLHHFVWLLIAKWSLSSHSTSPRITLSPAVYFQFQPRRCSSRPISFSLDLPFFFFFFDRPYFLCHQTTDGLFSVEEALNTLSCLNLFSF